MITKRKNNVSANCTRLLICLIFWWWRSVFYRLLIFFKLKFNFCLDKLTKQNRHLDKKTIYHWKIKLIYCWCYCFCFQTFFLLNFTCHFRYKIFKKCHIKITGLAIWVQTNQKNIKFTSRMTYFIFRLSTGHSTNQWSTTVIILY